MEQRTILIHAGLAKAGSTAIQTFLSDNEDKLRRFGIHYPVAGRPNKAHQQIAREICEAGNFNASFGTFSQLVDYWRPVSDGTLIISSEFLEEAQEHQIARFKELATNEGDKLQALIILRSVADIMTSGYAQRIKHARRAYDFDEFFNAHINESRIQHFQTVARWASQFGWENIHLRILDSRYLVNGDVIDDLLTLIGVDPGEIAEFSRPGMVNTAPGWMALEAIRALYAGTHGLPGDHPLADVSNHSVLQRKAVGREAARIAERLGWSSERGNYLTLEQARQCHEIQAANVRALNERLSAPLPVPPEPTASSFTAREFLPDASHIPPRQLRQLYDELGAAQRRSGARGGKSGGKKNKTSR